MSVPNMVMYPEDLSGLKASNLVTAEVHRPTMGQNQVIVPQHGPFFVESVHILDLVSGLPLAPHTQWLAVQLEADLSLMAGKDICSVIVVKDQNLSGQYQVTYQTVGGPYSYSVQAIIDMINALDLDNRPIEWKDILGVPDRFVPAPHPHHINDIGGWPVLFPALENIRNAILQSDQAVLDALRIGFQAEITRLDGIFFAVRDSLAQHLSDFNNPHRMNIHDIDGLTATEINLLLTRYLPIDGTAVNSTKFNNRTEAQHRTWLVGGIQNTELVNGQLPFTALATGYDTSMAGKEMPIPTAKGWRDFKDLVAAYGGGSSGAYFAGATTAAQIAITYSDNARYPIGTLVTYHYNHQIGHATGNGGVYYTNHNTRVIIQKYSETDWITVAAYQGNGYFYG